MQNHKVRMQIGRRWSPVFVGTLLCQILLNQAVLAATPSGPSEAPRVPKRINRARVVDVGRVHPLIMSVGMATLVELPVPINGKIPGSPESDLMLLNGPQPNQIVLELRRADARPTNLILVAGKRKVVFDIIPADPNHPTHQDIYEIVGFYGNPELDEGSDEALIDSSEVMSGQTAKVSQVAPGAGAVATSSNTVNHSPLPRAALASQSRGGK